jgi:phosphoribosylformylglycinamidine synthase
MTVPPRILILHAPGTNRDREAAAACEAAGGAPEIVHINRLAAGARRLGDYQMLLLPGGFSYGDDLGAGRLWANDLYHRFREDLDAFVAEGKPVIGICNGFQALVKAGYLPGPAPEQRVTLTFNGRGHFECRWVRLRANPASPCLFTRGLDMDILCPVAHGEGRLAVRCNTWPWPTRPRGTMSPPPWPCSRPPATPPTPTARWMTWPASATPPATSLA